jgi:hypothetical protein
MKRVTPGNRRIGGWGAGLLPIPAFIGLALAEIVGTDVETAV